MYFYHALMKILIYYTPPRYNFVKWFLQKKRIFFLVKNIDLWTQLDSLAAAFSALEWNWVKGHAGVKYNEICDSLCQKEILAQKAQ